MPHHLGDGPTITTVLILAQIAKARVEQGKRDGDHDRADGTGPAVLAPSPDGVWKALSELAREWVTASEPDWLLHMRGKLYRAFAEDDPAALRAHLVEVAAGLIRWIEAIDQRGGPGEGPAKITVVP